MAPFCSVDLSGRKAGLQMARAVSRSCVMSAASLAALHRVDAGQEGLLPCLVPGFEGGEGVQQGHPTGTTGTRQALCVDL